MKKAALVLLGLWLCMACERDGFYKGTRIIALELKKHSDVHEANAVAKTVQTVREAGLKASQVEFISFSLNACKALAAAFPGYAVAYLNGDLTPSEAKAAGLTGLDYHLSVWRRHPEWIREAHDLRISSPLTTRNT